MTDGGEAITYEGARPPDRDRTVDTGGLAIAVHEWGDQAAPPLLQRMVVAGLHGRKNGRGFYDYTVDPPVPSELGLGLGKR